MKKSIKKPIDGFIRDYVRRKDPCNEYPYANLEQLNREEADNIAGEIAQEVTPNYNNVYFENGRRMTRHMVFGDEYVEVEPVKGGE